MNIDSHAHAHGSPRDRGYTLSSANPVLNNRLPASGGADSDAAPASNSVLISETGQRRFQSYQSHSQSQLQLNLSSAIEAVDINPAAQRSADTILSFINTHLQNLQQSGATSEELEQALKEGLQGFQQGFDEGRQIVRDMGLMSDELQVQLDQTEQLVLAGIESYRQQYLGTEPSSSTAVDSATVVTRSVSAYQQQSYSLASPAGSPGRDSVSALHDSAAVFAASYRREESVDLQLRTQDGDIIRLQFNSRSAGESRGGYNATSQSANFSLTVRGDLDEGELAALTDLLQQVSELSDEFFNGDFDRAFAMALEFEFDSSEFSSLSLDLAKRSRNHVVTNAAGNNGRALGQLAQAGGDAGFNKLLGQLQLLRTLVETFAEPRELFVDLVANQLAQLIAGSTERDGLYGQNDGERTHAINTLS